ncbi:MAG: hypothetical protein ACK55Z_35895, partial [bacterium]
HQGSCEYSPLFVHPVVSRDQTFQIQHCIKDHVSTIHFCAFRYESGLNFSYSDSKAAFASKSM